MISGVDNAPDLVPRFVAEYHRLYPKVGPAHQPRRHESRPGGPGESEGRRRIPQPPALRGGRLAWCDQFGDSVMAYPVATAGIMVIAGKGDAGGHGVARGTARTADRGATRLGRSGRCRGWSRLYAPDPDLGVSAGGTCGSYLARFRSAQCRLGGNRARSGRGGLARSLGHRAGARSRPRPGTPPAGARAPDRQGPRTAAVEPLPDEIAAGDYPLFHYLYVPVSSGARHWRRLSLPWSKGSTGRFSSGARGSFRQGGGA